MGQRIMTPAWLQLIAGLALVIGSALQIRDAEYEDEEEDSEPWGFKVRDGGLVDGGDAEPDYSSDEGDWE